MTAFARHRRPRWLSGALLAAAALLAAPPGAAQISVSLGNGFHDVAVTHEGSRDEARVLVDFETPRIQITSPADGSVIAGNSLTVSGTVEDPTFSLPPEPTPLFGEVVWEVLDASFVRIGSGSAPVVDGRFTIPDVLLGTGEHLLSVAAFDSAGNSEPASVNVTSDPDAPPVALVGLADGEAVLTSSVVVGLSLVAPTTLVSVNGVPDGRGFPAGLALDALAIPLEVGANAVDLVLDAGDGPFSFSFTVFRVESAGPIRILEPTHQSLSNQTQAVVKGTVPRGTPFVTVNGVPATLAPDGVTFTASVPLDEGRNDIVARAYPFGQQVAVRVTRDTVPPVLEDLFPDDGLLTVEGDVALAGFASEPARVEAVGPGGAVQATTRARILSAGDPALGLPLITEIVFQLPALALVEGANAITLRLTDLAGNETLEPLSITRSDAALVLESPPDGGVVPDLRADVAVQALADVTLEAVISAGRRVPGFEGLTISAGLGAPSTFTLLGVPLVPGPSEIRLVYRRDGTGEREVLAFTLASTASDAATVTGTVTDSQTGNPLESALVSVFAGGLEFVVPTGPDGTFTLLVESGDVDVVVRREGFAGHQIEGTVAPGETLVADAGLLPESLTLPDMITLVGRVTSDLSGTPEPGVEIAVLASDRVAVTDATGDYVLTGVPGGRQSLRLRKGGFDDLFFTFEDLFAPLPGGSPLVQDFTYPLSRGDFRAVAVPPEATGSVADLFSGAPLANAQVRADGGNAFTDPAGRFSFSGLPPLSQVTFTAEAPDHETQSLTALVIPNAEDELRFALPPTTRGFVSGVVRDGETGMPVGEAEVRVPGSPLLATATGGDGSYRLVGVPAGTYTLEVIHPEYLLQQETGVVVANGGETVVDAALAPRPRTGSLEGRVRAGDDGSPVVGALLTGPDGISATTNADGHYRLDGLPAGLVRLSIEAPAFAPTTRGAAVTADLDPATPSLTEADFALAADGSVPDAVTRLVLADEGGAVETPDGRFAALILPGSLSADARITLRHPQAPPVANGAPLDLDPALGLEGIEAVGEATELLVEAPVDGDPAPVLEGPVALIARFAEADRAAADVAEAGLLPYYFDEAAAHWTALRIAPHLHAVDRIDNTALVVVDPSETETGAPVVAQLTTPEPVLLAQAGGALPDLRMVRRYLLQAASMARDLVLPAQAAAFIDFGQVSSTLKDAIHPNALPLFVVHGWSALAIVTNVPLVKSPLADPRFGPLLQDLVAGTDGVYRPIFLTYNSRVSPIASANALATQLLGPLLDGDIRGRPPGDDPEGGHFSFTNSFGFSMGGLVQRTLACYGGVGIQDMVSLGSPHHGALQHVVTLVEGVAGALTVKQLDIRKLLEGWSPGTVALLDYDDETGDGNLVLFQMNQLESCNRPQRTLSLIGGNESDVIDDRIWVGEKPNDGVVPLRSAHAEMKTGHTVPVLAALGSERIRKSEQPFNHHDVGAPQQPISAFASTDIFPVLSDWVVATIDRFERIPADPGPDEPQRVEVEVTVGYNVPHGDVTGWP